eukprot:6491360-Amphidinium_carterae.3
MLLVLCLGGGLIDVLCSAVRLAGFWPTFGICCSQVRSSLIGSVLEKWHYPWWRAPRKWALIALLIFQLGVDPLLRCLALPLGPVELVSAWADDIAQICMAYPGLLLAYTTLQDFACVSGLVLQRQKCVIIPLGTMDIDAWQRGLYEFLQSMAGVAEIPVREGARYLGVWIGRGPDLDCTQLGLAKLQARAEAVAGLGFGAPHGIHLYSVAGTSCVRHSLSCALPSEDLRRVWNQSFARHFSASQALGSTQYWAKELHCWPAS